MLRLRGMSRPIPAGTVLNVGSGVPTSLAEVLATVQAVVRRPLPVRYSEPRGFDRRDAWLDVAAARRVLGWRCRTDLRTGVEHAWRALTDDRRAASVAYGMPAG
jgi:UDP-glucose 4-epimerase